MMSILTILQRQFDLIETELIRYRNNPFDVERTHDLRVAIRTLRGLFKFLKREIPQAAFAVVDKNLSEAAKIFGTLRELDVLIAKSSEFAYTHPEEHTNYRHFFQDFHHRRQQEMERIMAPKVQQELTDYLAGVRDQLGILRFDKKTDWSKQVAQELKRRKNSLDKAFNQLDFKDYTRVHQIRKRAKTLRYSATYFAKLAPQKAVKVQKQAKKIQAICGEITDAHVNYDFLLQFAEQTDNSADKKLLLRIAQAQHELYAPAKKDS
ncbi:CHAD domain-containing protein [Liquorilactobacillus satsumensis]|uniref:CHAD domain-containing protein n=1 Tax=Liquorilactobacillus satsumensis TaxID=259059 RepID=UPI0021C4A1DC|nr:CHAD domain-containing protein [Liquorilactobacillus satsumensis]